MTIDLTPTWRGLLPALVEVAVRGETPESRRVAMGELYRLADLADRINAERDYSSPKASGRLTFPRQEVKDA